MAPLAGFTQWVQDCTRVGGGLREQNQALASGGELPFQSDWEPAQEPLTPYTRVPLLARAVRSFDVPESVKQHLHLKQRQRGFDAATYVESSLAPNALGGGCLEDFARFREDPGLGQMLGHELPNPENLAVHVGLLGVVQRALAALAETIQEQYLRGDSACNEQTLLGWLRNRPSAKWATGIHRFCGERADERIAE